MIKKLLPMFLGLSILLGAVFWLFYHSDINSQKRLIASELVAHVNIQSNTIASHFNNVVSDLAILSELHELRQLVDNIEDYSSKELEDDFLSISLRKGFYYQIRFIKADGQEILRVDYSDGKSFLASNNKLQNKADRYYFKETMSLSREEVYISPLDLNVEKGEVEIPFEPMIRFGTPILNSQDEKRGALILNFLAKSIIDEFKSDSHHQFGQKGSLLNSEGYWLAAPNPENEWGFMLIERKDKTFGNRHPGTWKKIHSDDNGQFQTDEGLFTFTTFYPLLAKRNIKDLSKEVPSPSRLDAKTYFWKIVSFIPQDLFDNASYEQSGELRGRLVKLYAGLLLLTGFGTFTYVLAREERIRAVEELKKYKDHLEDEVEKRTAELTIENEKMSNALFRAEEVLIQLAKPPLAIPFFTTSPMYHTSRTVGGGDTVRWVSFRSRYAGVYLHDVSGHDIQETLLNILATALADDCKTNPLKKAVSLPSIFLTNLNKELIKFCEKTGHFITAVYALMDFNSREMKLSLAGHPKPWLIDPNGSVEQVGEQGFMMGQFDIKPAEKVRYRDTSLMLKTGQLLLIYSDGLMEQKDDKDIDFESKFKSKIMSKLKGLEPDNAYTLVKSEFESHLSGKTPEDDVSFIFIGTRPAEKYETLNFRPGQPLITFIREHKRYVCPIHDQKEPASPYDSQDVNSELDFREIHHLQDAYKSIINKISQDGWPDKKINEIEVALGELVINAILHGNLASESYTVQVTHILHNDTLEVSVTDEGRGFDGSILPQVIEDEDLLKESGRGLSLISMYADKMYFNDSGNRCWLIFTK